MSSTKNLLVVSNKWDAHADAFVRTANDCGKSIVRINTEDFRANHINISSGGQSNFSWYIKTPEQRMISCDSISGVYVRRISMPIDVRDIDNRFHDFVRREAHVILDALISTLLEEKRWLNRPYARERASNKIRQLLFAEKVGLTTPSTLITNQAMEALVFCANMNPVIYKTLCVPIINFPHDQQSIINTSIVNLQKDFSAVKHAPTLFQEYIDKKYELRIHVIGETIIPVRIYSQVSEETCIDWRVAQGSLECEVADIPQEVQTKIHALMLGLGIRFGIIDMIVTDGGEHVFLEVNPDGNWLWLPPDIHPLITEAVVSYF